MDHEKFRNVLTGIQSLILSLAIVVGGLWTLFAFDALREADNSLADLELKVRELEERRVLIVTIEPAQLSIPGDPARYISASVRFENVGNHTKIIYWPTRPFNVSRLWIDEAGSLQSETLVGWRVHAGSLAESGLRLMPGVVVNREFLARVDKPGLYYLELEVEASSEEQEQAATEGVFGRVSWSDIAHIVVK